MSREVSAKDIVVLSGLEAVRKNPSMYVGSVGEAGAQHLLREVVHNSVDEALAGRCARISVTLAGDLCKVADDGRGIPTERHPAEGVSGVEVVLTRLHSGTKFSREPRSFSAGLHGIGLSCVNALSKELLIEIRRDGKRHVQEFRRGEPRCPIREAGPTAARGTTIAFRPDREIFRTFRGFDEEACARFLEELSFLNPGVEFALTTPRDKCPRVFRNVSGMPGLLGRLSPSSRRLCDPIEIRIDARSLEFRAAIQWTTGREPLLRSYANCVDTALGGSHVNAFKAGVARAVSRVLRETGRTAGREDAAELDEVMEGVVAAIDLKLAAPSFEGQTKTRLTNAEIESPIEAAAFEQTLSYFRGSPSVAAVIADRIAQVRSAKIAARRAAERIYFQRVERGIDEDVYREQFGARSRDWHKSAAWITHKDLLKAHASLCKAPKDGIALDVCCGSGVVGAAFKSRVSKVMGLDLTPEMIAMAKTRLDDVREGNVYDIPFEDDRFDLACSREVLHLLPYPEKPVSEIFRVLKPGGQFIVGQILPFGADDAAWMFRVFKKKQPLIFNMFQEEDFNRLLAGAGFVDLEMKELNVWESIDTWIDSHETTALHRHEIRQLFLDAPAEAKAIHPFKILPSGEIRDLWRWCVFSARKPR